MVHLGEFAVHHTVRAHNLASVGLSNALVPQANAEQGDFACEMSDGGNGNAGLIGGAGARGDDNFFRCHRLDVGQGQGIVAKDLHVRPQLPQILDDVVGERVVIIDH